MALIGPSTPLTPRLHSYGIEVLGGLIVENVRGLARPSKPEPCRANLVSSGGLFIFKATQTSTKCSPHKHLANIVAVQTQSKSLICTVITILIH